MWSPNSTSMVIAGENLNFLNTLPDESFNMIYIDPPFNTGRTQEKQLLQTKRAEQGDRRGFKGLHYTTTKGALHSYEDAFTNYGDFLKPRLLEAHRILKDTGTIYVHLDYREVHYVKVMMDEIFGRTCFLNEIIWAYDYGAKTKKKWPAKHDNILMYAKNSTKFYFNNEEIDREPYMAPGLISAEKFARGKLPTDVWWHTIVSPTGYEKTGYPSQKPEGLLRRMITASTQPDEWILDFFAGSGTTGAVAHKLGRKFVMVEQNPQAHVIMQQRLPHADIL